MAAHSQHNGKAHTRNTIATQSQHNRSTMATQWQHNGGNTLATHSQNGRKTCATDSRGPTCLWAAWSCEPVLLPPPPGARNPRALTARR
eukprot:3670703-Pyramimonas_sp.AAC.1